MPSLSIPQLITNTATAAGVPPALALQVAQQESSLNPSAIGGKGELGLFQLMPSEAAALGVTDPLDPIENTQGGVAYLAQLYAQFGNWATALAAYNWGPSNVLKYGAAAAPASTQSYVASALSAAGLSPPASSGADPYATAAPSLLPDGSTDPSTYDAASVLPAITVSPSPIYTIALLALGVYLGARLLFAE